jgi:hypothetical protein
MKTVVVAGLVLIAASTASASQGKPGLWEFTTTMNFAEGGPQIPPEQLEKMKQMGINLPFGKPVTTQVCVTPQMASREEPMTPSRPQDQCQMKNMNKSSNSVSADLVCSGENKGDGHFQVNYASNAAYSGSMDFKGMSKRGPVSMHTDFNGKWVADDCGNVKPPAGQ